MAANRECLISKNKFYQKSRNKEYFRDVREASLNKVFITQLFLDFV